MYYSALFEDKEGKQFTWPMGDCALEDATIEASNIAENKGWDLLSVEPDDDLNEFYFDENYK